MAPNPGGGGTGTDFIVDVTAGDDVDDGFSAFSSVPVVELLLPPPPLPVAINPLENATLTTPLSYFSHREIRGLIGPWTAHKT